MSHHLLSPAASALRKSMEIRAAVGADAMSPVCVWRVCDHHGLYVRFAPLHIEGLYVRHAAKPLILVCSQRPLVRRVFTGAHELGHHVFGHGSTLDETLGLPSPSSEERLVDLFAGFLLMPPLGIRRAFAVRGLNPISATELDYFTVACSFGVGYTTLLDHSAFTLRIISRDRAMELKKRTTPKQIRSVMIPGSSATNLIIVDSHWSSPTIDAEVGDEILLPEDAQLDGDNFRVRVHPTQVRVEPTRPGIAQVQLGSRAVFLRVSRPNYEGLVQYRHLEDPEFEDEGLHEQD